MTYAETYVARVEAAAADYAAARAAYQTWFDAKQAEVYAEMRAADKTAGRDTSGKSVSRRRCLAHDRVMMSDEAHSRRAVVDAAEAAYRAAKEF